MKKLFNLTLGAFLLLGSVLGQAEEQSTKPTAPASCPKGQESKGGACVPVQCPTETKK